MMPWYRRIASFAVTWVFIAAVNAEPPTPKPAASAEAVNREWVIKDIAVADGVREILPQTSTTFADLYSAVRKLRPGSSPTTPEGRDIGFGGAWHEFQFHGGYTTVVLQLITFDGRVAQLRGGYLGMPRARWKLLRGDLLAHWPAKTVDSEDGPAWSYVDHAVFDAFEAKVHAALGPRIEQKVPAELAADYALLTDPLNDLRFGTMCGDGGDKPLGRVAIEHLAGAADGDHLVNVLRGDNPVGRVYAAEALLARRGIADLNEPDKATIAAIKRLDIPIAVCDGCELSDSRASKLLVDKPASKK